MANKNIDIKPDTMLSRNPDVQFSKIDEEVVLLSPDGANYIKINEIGSRIWEILESKTSYYDLIEKLMEEFEVNRIDCEADLIPFLQKANRYRIIKTIN